MRTTKLTVTFALILGVGVGCSSTKSSAPPKSAPASAAEPAMTPAAGRRSEQARAAPEGEVEVIMLTGIGVEPSLSEACNIDVPEVFFEFDASKLEAPAPKTLDGIVSCLTTGPLRAEGVRLIGHTDPSGTDAYNEKLGLSRAESVGKYLEHHGIGKDRIIVETGGAEHALDIPRVYPFDRRVDIDRAGV